MAPNILVLIGGEWEWARLGVQYLSSDREGLPLLHSLGGAAPAFQDGASQ